MDRSAGTPRSQTLTRSYKARLPYPLGVYWARVANATTPHDAMLAAEGIVRVLAAPLLADVVHGPWTPELEQLLRVGQGEKPKLKDPVFGTRLAFLRALVASHALLTESLLGDVQGWWREVGNRAGVLDTVVTNRNDVFHGRVILPPHEQASLLSEVRGHVAGLLRGASFLYNIQWVHADGPSEDDWNQRRGGIRRLCGPHPYRDERLLAAWPTGFQFARNFVYMGTADGRQWRLLPFVALETGTSGTEGHPRVLVLDAVERERLVFMDPLSPREKFPRNLPGLRGEPISWKDFIDRRDEIVVGWRQAIDKPHAKLVLKELNDFSTSLTPGGRLGRFELIDKLGEGGAAEVWEVREVSTQRPYALKVLKGSEEENENEFRRFEAEVDTLQRLAARKCRRVFENVVPSSVQDGDTLRTVLCMPLMKGTLKDHADEVRAAQGGQPPTEELVRDWLRMGLEALVDLHANGVIHRDIKPSNFLVDAQGELVVADFGIARDHVHGERLTQTHDRVGTRGYWPPEQEHGSAKEVTAAVDVFALGASILELWTGQVRPPLHVWPPGALGELLRDMTRLEPPAMRPTAAQALERVVGPQRRRETPTATTGAPTPSSTQSGPFAAAAEPGAMGRAEALAELRERCWNAADNGQLSPLKRARINKFAQAQGLSEADVAAVPLVAEPKLLGEAVAEASEEGILDTEVVELLETIRIKSCVSQQRATALALERLPTSLVLKAPQGVLPPWLAAALEGLAARKREAAELEQVRREAAEARKLEEFRKAAEARKAEETRKAEQARKAEETRKAEEASRAPVRPGPNASNGWFLWLNGFADGPHDVSELQQRLAAGSLASGQLVYHHEETAAAWVAAGTVALLKISALEGALRMCVEVHGPASEPASNALLNLTDGLRGAGRHKEVVRRLQNHIVAIERVEGPEHPKTLDLRAVHASLLSGDAPEQAYELLRPVVPRVLNCFGFANVVALECATFAAALAARRGDWLQALLFAQLQVRSADLLSKPNETPNLALLGLICQAVGQHERAAHLFARVFSEAAQWQDPDQAELERAIASFGRSLLDLRRRPTEASSLNRAESDFVLARQALLADETPLNPLPRLQAEALTQLLNHAKTDIAATGYLPPHAPEPPYEVQVTIQDSQGESRSVVVAKASFHLGRSETCEVVVPDPSMAERHLRVQFVGAKLWVEVLASSNDIRLNGTLLQARRYESVTEGDYIYVGDKIVLVLALRAAPTTFLLFKCPACNASYLVPRSLLGSEGRGMMNCAQCASSVHVTISTGSILDCRLITQRVMVRLTAEHGGLGVVFSARGDEIVVRSVSSGGPAAAAGIRAGDILEAIDGQACAGLSPSDVVALLGRAETHDMALRRVGAT